MAPRFRLPSGRDLELQTRTRERMVVVKTSIAGAILACLPLSVCTSAQQAFSSPRAVGMRSASNNFRRSPAGNFQGFPGGPFARSFLCGGNSPGVRGGLGFGGFGGPGFGGLSFGGLCGGFGFGGVGTFAWPGGVLPWGFSDILRPDQGDGEPIQAIQPQEAALPSPFFGAPMPPSPPARSVIREYNWPASTTPSASTISLVLKDGTVRLAIAVWTEDGTLHYTSRDGTVGRLSLDAINREATTRANAEGHVSLWLPASKEVR